MNTSEAVSKEKYRSLKAHLDERSLRLCAAADARSIGRGGISIIARVSGIARNIISAGLKDLDGDVSIHKIRRAGAGRKALIEKNYGMLGALKKWVDPATRGDPENPLCWISKSTTKLAR